MVLKKTGEINNPISQLSPLQKPVSPSTIKKPNQAKQNKNKNKRTDKQTEKQQQKKKKRENNVDRNSCFHKRN